MLLPHNNDVTKPLALNLFLSGFAELEFDKGFIKNKKVPRDLIEKGYRNNKNTFDNESIVRKVHRIERKRGNR